MNWFNLIGSLVLTIFFYMLVPTIICLFKPKLSKRTIMIITIINGIVFFIFFRFLSFMLGDEVTFNTAPAFLWSGINYSLLKKKCLKDTDEEEAISYNNPNANQNAPVLSPELETIIFETTMTEISNAPTIEYPHSNIGYDTDVFSEPTAPALTDMKSKKPKKIIKKIVCILLIITLVLLIASLTMYSYAAYQEKYQEKMNNYDLKTSSHNNSIPNTYSSYKNRNKIKDLYTYNAHADTTNAVRHSLYFTDTQNMYTEVINVISDENYHKTINMGIYEYDIDEKILYTQNVDGEIVKYYIVGDFLIKEYALYLGTVPKADTFNAFFTLPLDDGTSQTLLFNEDGTFVETIDDQEYNGTYSRDGYLITCIGNGPISYREYLVYNGLLIYQFFQEDHYSPARYQDKIEYDFCVFIRDYIPDEYGYYESHVISEYENKYPITGGY